MSSKSFSAWPHSVPGGGGSRGLAASDGRREHRSEGPVSWKHPVSRASYGWQCCVRVPFPAELEAGLAPEQEERETLSVLWMACACSPPD